PPGTGSWPASTPRPQRCGRRPRSWPGVAPLGVEIRVGLHTGEVELEGDEVAGVGVHLAARVMAEAEAGQVLVSSTVRDLLAGSGLRFVDLGARKLKGFAENWRLFAVDLA